MNFNHDEKMIKERLEQVDTPKIENLYEKVNQRRQKSYKPKPSFKFIMAGGLCCCLLVMMAFDNFYFKKLVSLVGTEVFSLIQPIQLIDESDGIRLEVLGAMNDDESAIVYLTLQDLTGEIIDETLDIYNYSLSRGSAFYMQKIDYDEQTHTATFRLKGNGGKNLNGKKVHFGIQSFLTQKVTYDATSLLNSWDIVATHSPKTMSVVEGTASTGLNGYYAQEDAKILKPYELDLEVPGLNFVRLSNIGFIDNQLHVQIEWREDNIDDHVLPYLTDLNDNFMSYCIDNISFGYEDETLTYGRNIDEYIFDITPEELQNVKLKGDFVYNGQYTEGNWQVSFKLDSVGEEVKQDVSLVIDETLITEVSVSALGVTIRGTGTNNSFENIQLTLNNGETLISDSSVGVLEQTVDNSEFVTKMLFPAILKPSEIKSIQINDEVIEFN